MANGAIVRLGNGGQVCVNVGRAAGHIILDVAGYLPSPSGQPQMQLLQQPVRIVETRTAGPIPAAGSTPCFSLVGGPSGVPGDASGVIVNLTSTGATDFGWLTLFPSLRPLPATSMLNFDPRAYAIANGAIVRVGGGMACVNVGRSASYVIIDVTGYLAP
jgi:hypothetical protein